MRKHPFDKASLRAELEKNDWGCGGNPSRPMLPPCTTEDVVDHYAAQADRMEGVISRMVEKERKRNETKS